MSDNLAYHDRDLSVKKSFFDREAVMARMSKAKLKVLSKFGAFVRRRAKSSIRYKAKGVSAPGDPPFAHRSSSYKRKKFNKKTGETTQQPSSPLRELIFFAYDHSTESVVVGPVLFKAGGARLLEFGGTTTLRLKTKTRTMHYRARPFMRPALEAERPSFADQLRGMMGK